MKTKTDTSGKRFGWSFALALAAGLSAMAVSAQQNGPLIKGSQATACLSDFGPVTKPAEVQAAFKKATDTLSESGGTLLLSPSESKQLNVKTPFNIRSARPGLPRLLKTGALTAGLQSSK